MSLPEVQGRWRVLVRTLVFGLLAWAAALTITADAADTSSQHGEHHPVEHSPKAHASKSLEEREKTGAMEHVLDQREEWHVFDVLWPQHVHLPEIFGFQITKFMILELIAAVAIAAIYIPLARRLQSGAPPRGGWDNAFEVLLTFIRKDVAQPSIGEHDADRFLPFLWTLFLFILFNNLLGMFPFAGSPTASIFVTAGLALIVFFAIHGSAIAKMGFGHYMETLWPHIEVPFPLGFPIKLLVCLIEIVGTLVRNAVLAVRLFANMFAGHMVLATILMFILMARNTAPALWGTITLTSVLGILALSLLELFVAFLQAYIFVFLTALFMGMAMHPQH